MLPGIIGSLQAVEAIKWILGAGESLSGRLLHYDAMSARVREFRLKRDPECPLCGANPSITSPIDYDEFCGGNDRCGVVGHPSDVSVDQLAGLLPQVQSGDIVLLDVREPDEVEAASITGSLRIPLGVLTERLSDIPDDRRVLVHCKSGGRSAVAVDLLRDAGRSEVSNVAGGMDAWSARSTK